jgi:hypothetical protein
MEEVICEGPYKLRFEYVDWIISFGNGPVAGLSEHGNEHLDSLMGRGISLLSCC